MKFKKYVENMKCDGYGKEHESEKELEFDCSLGINPFGFSKTINGVIGRFDFEKLNSYPMNNQILKESISNFWRNQGEIDYEQIYLGNGSMDCINQVNKLFISEGEKALGYVPQFPDYRINVESFGGIFDYVSMIENNCKFNIDKFVSRFNDEYKIIYIDNPNNPTGQVIGIEEIDFILKKASKFNCCVVIDEAYGEFMGKENSAINLLDKYENLLVTRSFSKGYGMAGLRMGYMITSKTIMNELNKITLPFAMNSLALIVGECLIKDQKFISSSIEKTRTIKRKFLRELGTMKFMETNMDTPIITLMHPDNTIDLKKQLYINGINTVGGNNFQNLSKNYVRIRISEDVDELINRINRI